MIAVRVWAVMLGNYAALEMAVSKDYESVVLLVTQLAVLLAAT